MYGLSSRLSVPVGVPLLGGVDEACDAICCDVNVPLLCGELCMYVGRCAGVVAEGAADGYGVATRGN